MSYIRQGRSRTRHDAEARFAYFLDLLIGWSLRVAQGPDRPPQRAPSQKKHAVSDANGLPCAGGWLAANPFVHPSGPWSKEATDADAGNRSPARRPARCDMRDGVDCLRNLISRATQRPGTGGSAHRRGRSARTTRSFTTCCSICGNRRAIVWATPNPANVPEMKPLARAMGLRPDL